VTKPPLAIWGVVRPPMTIIGVVELRKMAGGGSGTRCSSRFLGIFIFFNY
jgi:hypothetical protein